MKVRKRLANEYVVNLDDKEVESLKEQAGKQEQSIEEVLGDIIKTGWATCFSDDEETR